MLQRHAKEHDYHLDIFYSKCRLSFGWLRPPRPAYLLGFVRPESGPRSSPGFGLQGPSQSAVLGPGLP
jgi:hypothetical protein